MCPQRPPVDDIAVNPVVPPVADLAQIPDGHVAAPIVPNLLPAVTACADRLDFDPCLAPATEGNELCLVHQQLRAPGARDDLVPDMNMNAYLEFLQTDPIGRLHLPGNRRPSKAQLREAYGRAQINKLFVELNLPVGDFLD
jgi:hypothetical protein